MLTADDLVRRLALQPHPEGGFFHEMYRADERIEAEALPPRYGSKRVFGTAIYYLLTPDTFSELHRLESDEVYHFYLGDPVEQLRLFSNGRGEVVVLGNDLAAGQQPQVVVPRGVWQGLRIREGGAHGYSLLGCTMAPGFEFDDFESGMRAALREAYPEFDEMILELTRE